MATSRGGQVRPQVLRLPAASAPGARPAVAASGGPTKLVLVGGSQGTSTTGTPNNKVIMVRSQGGSVGNLSTQQLLQLLQVL